MGFSVVALIDGAPGCGDESVLGYGGLPIWTITMIYLMTGLYLVCEHHFVPSLQILGKEMGLSEDAQGATIMAAGSSSPEFFTALIGVLFYANENPGPGTIVGSAVFNVSVIVGCCALFAPRPLMLNKFSLYRDSISYLFTSIILLLFYEVITPGYIDIWESLLMVCFYVLYAVVVCRREKTIELMTKIFEPCMPNESQTFTRVPADEDDIKQGNDGLQMEMRVIGDGSPRSDSLGNSNDHVLSNDHILPIARANGLSEKEGEKETEEGKEEIKDRKEDKKEDGRLRTRSGSNGTQLDEPLTLSVAQPGERKRRAHTRQMSILTTQASRCGIIAETVYAYAKKPMEIAFKYTIPDPEYFSFKYCFVLTFIMSVIWLGVLTFLVVDLAEKFGNCCLISEDLIGLSILAVGSSLPDCISSVLIAMECKGDMAVCNALGSNVFDILLCLGFTFFLQSCIQKGASIQVEHGPGFLSLLGGLFLLQAIFNGILAWSNHMLHRWHGYTLIVLYFFFLCYFFFDYEYIVPKTEG
mmetsp:Transcript_36976/g.68243  ORF Transcript_36976/g.68243 Transcript_36976/m.68243 type:complete len:527 (-) Transcript_36976:254-1834(-)|eukprot:CAMPEP_0170180862 /NCGR_PEP_ID=MMETSP0040_2-20121228/23233_1 /TAXON_ID=641309 /ORGANISM="Lotharella oceanica, Strain CCMP622" /LENGTH=526 /DNA_ID=CAMNT_0010425653 /DNA_START=91 /DNA_END=1671 /DNA_ORIENTATION=-